MSTTLRGFDKLLRKLEGLERKGAKRAMRKATRAGTAVLLKAVKKATPKDEGVLRKMQTSKVYGRGLSMAGIVGADVAKLQAAESDPRNPRPSNIDHLVEEGHVAPDGTFVPPTGYMRRAADSAMPAAAAKYTQVLAAEIEREASK